MAREVNAFIRDGIPEGMYFDGVGELIDKAEERRWFGKLKYPAKDPHFEFTFRFGVCQCFTTVFQEKNALFYMNTNNPNVDFGRKRNEGTEDNSK